MKVNENNEVSIESEVYSTRLLVFIETHPQTNEYHQVFLDKKQFKKVSDAIIISVKRVEGLSYDEEVELFWSTESYPLPDLKEINE